MAATPKPKPKSAEEQAQESLKRLALFAGGAMILLSLFASWLGRRHRVAETTSIPVSVPAAEAPPAEGAPSNEPQDLAPLPVLPVSVPPAEAEPERRAPPPSGVSVPTMEPRGDGTWAGGSGGPPMPNNP
jgi:hypothetical protein